MERSRVLYCDYDDDFSVAEEISSAGYLVDQIKPDALRSVGIDEHVLYIFAFGSSSKTNEVLRVCERLKSAELKTPILLYCRGPGVDEFLAHSLKKKCADYYLTEAEGSWKIYDVLKNIIGEVGNESPGLRPTEEVSIPTALRPETTASTVMISDSDWKNQAEEWKTRFEDLELRIDVIQDEERKRTQTEVEKLKVELSEQEAKLLDREAKFRELEQASRANREKLEKIEGTHSKALTSLREFYQSKIRDLQTQMGLSDEAHDTETQALPEFDENTILLRESSLSRSQSSVSEETDEIDRDTDVTEASKTQKF